MSDSSACHDGAQKSITYSDRTRAHLSRLATGARGPALDSESLAGGGIASHGLGKPFNGIRKQWQRLLPSRRQSLWKHSKNWRQKRAVCFNKESVHGHRCSNFTHRLCIFERHFGVAISCRDRSQTTEFSSLRHVSKTFLKACFISFKRI